MFESDVKMSGMNDEQQNKPPSFFRAMFRSIWEVEKLTWRWAAALGVLGAVLVAIIGGFFRLRIVWLSRNGGRRCPWRNRWVDCSYTDLLRAAFNSCQFLQLGERYLFFNYQK